MGLVILSICNQRLSTVCSPTHHHVRRSRTRFGERPIGSHIVRRTCFHQILVGQCAALPKGWSHSWTVAKAPQRYAPSRVDKSYSSFQLKHRRSFSCLVWSVYRAVRTDRAVVVKLKFQKNISKNCKFNRNKMTYLQTASWPIGRQEVPLFRESRNRELWENWKCWNKAMDSCDDSNGPDSLGSSSLSTSRSADRAVFCSLPSGRSGPGSSPTTFRSLVCTRFGGHFGWVAIFDTQETLVHMTTAWHKGFLGRFLIPI